MSDEADTLREALAAAIGAMMNAKIDLETGCTKAAAINAIEGGIKRAKKALAQDRKPDLTVRIIERPGGMG